jgi:tetratricopeptide (TPR) repeat protein
LAEKVLDQTNREAGGAIPPGRTGSAEGGRGADDRHPVELAASVAVAGTSEPAPSKIVNAAVVGKDRAWQAKLERAEAERRDQLYRLAEASQAAVDVLRPKLAQAEAEIDRLERSRTAVATELYHQTNAHEAMQVSMASSQMEIARLRVEITRLREGADQVESDARQGQQVEFALRGEIEKLRRSVNRTERQRRERAEEAEAFRVEVARLRLAATQAQQEAAERGASLRAIEGEAPELRARLGERDAAVTAAHERSRAVEARLAKALGEIGEMRAQLEAATKEKAERGAAVETLKAELAALRGDLSATGQVARELMTASTADLVAPQKPNQGGGVRSTMLGFGRAMRARAITGGDRARDAKRWQVAARYYHRALARDPFDAPTLVQYGHALKEAGHLSEAEAAYRRSFACAPGVADTHLQLGHVLKLQGRTPAAQAAYMRALTLDPTMPFPARELAGLGWSSTHIARLCELSETSGILQLRSLRETADAARDRGDWPSAATLYGELVAADPTALDISVQLGHAHKEMGDLERAAHAYYSVLEVTPSDDDLHLQIGHLEKLRGNLAAAAAHYKKAVELNPNNVDARRESEALSSIVREIRPKEDSETGPGEERTDGGQADHHTTDDLRFLDERAGDIYRQLIAALA